MSSRCPLGLTKALKFALWSLGPSIVANFLTKRKQDFNVFSCNNEICQRKVKPSFFLLLYI